jgi:hypothetical protein
MKKIKITKPVNRDKDNTLVLNFDADEASSDWLGYSWLKKLLVKETKKQRKKLNVWMLIR